MGTNSLIKEFAQIVTTPEDILLKYGFIEIAEKSVCMEQSIKNIDDVSEEYKDVYKLITNKPIDVNEIVKNSNIDLKNVISKLTMLELEGKIRKVAGNRYIKGDD